MGLFEKPLSDDEEYWVGYFRADGCITRHKNNKYKSAQFAQVERFPVAELAKFIGREGCEREYHRDTNFGSCTYYMVSSSAIAYPLDNLGAKTVLDPSLYLSSHFWRGLLDGDGSVKSAGKAYATIDWNGRLEDLTQLKIFIETTTGQPSQKIHNHGSIYRLCMGGKKAMWMLRFLYENQYSANLLKSARAFKLMEEDDKLQLQTRALRLSA